MGRRWGVVMHQLLGMGEIEEIGEDGGDRGDRGGWGRNYFPTFSVFLTFPTFPIFLTFPIFTQGKKINYL
jgi:hypothetical protein